jgi:hypothetical protein
MSNRYMPKPYRCNVCFLSFNTERQAQRHWFDAHEHAIDDRSASAPRRETGVARKGENAVPERQSPNISPKTWSS